MRMPASGTTPFRLALISTGGTIEKTYDEFGGMLSNRMSVLDLLLGSLDLRGLTIDRVPLMNKDSLEMSEADHDLIADTAEIMSRNHDGVVIVHGTDRLATSGQRIHERLSGKGLLAKPIVLTGAMRPYELRRTDAVISRTPAEPYTGCFHSANTIKVQPFWFNRGSMPDVIFSPLVSVNLICA